MRLKSEFLHEIKSRGFIYQSSDLVKLDELISKKRITAYRYARPIRNEMN